MIQNFASSLRPILAGSIILCLLVGCKGYSITGGPGSTVTPNLLTHVAAPGDLLTINTVTLAPMQFDDRVRVYSHRQPEFYKTMQESAQNGLGMQLISGEAVFRKIAKNSDASLSRDELVGLGASLSTDAVIVGKLLQYSEREGSRIGANEPAAVDFSVALYRISDGKELWSASYHFKDQALSENLFKLNSKVSHGAGWQSAQALLKAGLNQAFQDLAARRSSEFSSSH